jgi:hypothetical protein
MAFIARMSVMLAADALKDIGDFELLILESVSSIAVKEV